MKDIVNKALSFHSDETGHDLQFKEEWVYDRWERNPHLLSSSSEEMRYKIILRGSTRFEQAHATIEFADGSRWVIWLNPRNPGAPLEHQEWNLARGKAKQIRWPGGATIPPQARIA